MSFTPLPPPFWAGVAQRRSGYHNRGCDWHRAHAGLAQHDCAGGLIPTHIEYAIIGAVILAGVVADELLKKAVARRQSSKA